MLELAATAWSVIISQWNALLLLLAVFGVGVILTFGLLRRSLPDEQETAGVFVLALAGWSLPWVGCAFLAFFVNRVLNFGPAWAAFWLALFGLALLPGWKKMPAPFGKISGLFFALLVVFLLSLLSRLAFLSDLIVPTYFDGALHYSITRHLLLDFGVWPWKAAPPPVSGYYHIGFHLLTAATTSITNVEVSQAILILGQFLLAVMPFPVFFFIRRTTNSTLPAFFALLLAGWGWNMPAHALNWGKYPALAGLLALQFALACLILLDRRHLWHWGVSLAAIGVAGLMHSRSLVVLGLFIASSLAAGWWVQRGRALKWLTLSLLLAALGALGVYLQSRDILKLVFDPYLRFGLWMTLLVAALSPFAFRRYEKLALTSLLTGFLLMASLLIPLPGEAFQTLLDRPFVQMTLYLPLALLGGLGLAGLWAESFKGWQMTLVTVAAFSAIGVHVGRDYVFLPSPCCVQFKSDDAVAMDWMKERLPPDAHILIAGNLLNVFDVTKPAGLRSSDGGVWITPLLGLRTSVQPYGIDFGSETVFLQLCQAGVTHIYVGGTPESFSMSRLQSRPQWYAWQFSLPGAHLFGLVGCP